MSALLELQRAMGPSVLQDAQLADALTPENTRWHERLAIYRHNCRSTLVNALRLSFPAVRHLVGEDCFATLAAAFAQARPPQTAYLNDYGAEFPGFVAQFPAAQTLGYLGDVARLEWAVNQALHARDAVALDVSRLAALDSSSLPYLSLQRHPSVSALSTPWPADLIWRAVLVQDDAAMAAIEMRAGSVWLLIERDAAGPQVRRLSASDGPFVAALLEGRPLHEAIACCEGWTGDQIQTCLAAHLSAGRFIDFRPGARLPVDPFLS